MKTETCAYSGYKIHPGHGKRMVRLDGKLYIFLSSKCARGFLLKRNPRDITWTVLYRRKNKKGTQAEEHIKRKTRRVVKFHRAIGNTTVEAILAKRNQKPEFRKQQRENAIKAAKEKTRAEKATKKAEKTKDKKAAPKQAKAKTVKAAVPRVGGKR